MFVLVVVEFRIGDFILINCNMGLSDDGDEDRTRERFDELCSDLNMDLDAKTDAWQSYTRIIANYTLEVAPQQIMIIDNYCQCRTKLVVHFHESDTVYFIYLGLFCSSSAVNILMHFAE